MNNREAMDALEALIRNMEEGRYDSTSAPKTKLVIDQAQMDKFLKAHGMDGIVEIHLDTATAYDLDPQFDPNGTGGFTTKDKRHPGKFIVWLNEHPDFFVTIKPQDMVRAANTPNEMVLHELGHVQQFMEQGEERMRRDEWASYATRPTEVDADNRAIKWASEGWTVARLDRLDS